MRRIVMSNGRCLPWCRLFVLAAALFGGFAAVANGQVLSGAVQGAGNAPVEAAEVRAIGSNGIITVVLTNAQGKFEFPDLDAGSYTVTAYRKFYGRSPEKKIQVGKGSVAANFSISPLSAPPAIQLSTADLLPLLPGPNDERDAFVAHCGDCHNLSTPLQRPRSAAEWGNVIDFMKHIEFGELLLSPERIKPALDYLTKNFGPDSTLIGGFGKEAEEQHQQPVPLGTDIEYKQYTIPRPPWSYNDAGVPPMPDLGLSDGKGTVWFTVAAGHDGPDGKHHFGVGKVEVATGKFTFYNFKTPIPFASPFSMSFAPDGKVWFAARPIIGNIDPKTGVMEEIPLPPSLLDGKAPGGGLVPPDFPKNQPMSGMVAVGNDGMVWTNLLYHDAIASYNPETKTFKSYDVSGMPFGMAWNGGKVWMTMMRANKVGYMDPDTGEVKAYDIPSPRTGTERVKIDQKGRAWLPERDANKLGLLEPGSDHVVETELPYECVPYSLEIDQKGAIWVICQNRQSLVRVDPDTKAMMEYPEPCCGGGSARELFLDPKGIMWYAEWLGGKVTAVKELGPGNSVKSAHASGGR